MRIVTLTMCLLVMALIAGCNKAEKSPPTIVQPEAPAATTDSAEPDSSADAGSDYTALAGTKLSLASGDEVEIISVGKFDTDLQSLGGTIALEGRVAEVFADKGRMLLVDTDRMKACQDGCCPQAEVPVRLALENFEGKMPTAESEVIVVGDLTITNMGYEFAVQEIRQGGDVLMHSAAETV